MTSGGDPPKKPPRASWEPPDAELPDIVSEPPPGKPPRASWEPPAPEEIAAAPVVEAQVEAAPVEAAPVEAAPSLPSAPVAEPPALDSSDDPLAPLPSAPSAAPPPPPRRRRPPTDLGDDDTDDDDDAKPRRNRKLMFVAAASLLVGLGIASLAILGSLNKHRFVITCEPDQIVAGQGRGFPPWGTRELDDDAMWKPIKIPPEAECIERETEDEMELSGWFLETLEARAETLLKARDVAKTDEAAALLEQALLHTRPSERRDQRARIERLLGDVQYWRASAKLRDAVTALGDAAKQFDTAAAQRPRHVSDAAAWALHVRRLIEELQGGPAGTPQTAFPPTPPTGTEPPRPPAPPGTALPVEPDPDAGAGSAEAPPSPEAGIPTGGVLL